MSETEPNPSAWAFKSFRFFTFAGILLPFASQIQSLIIGWQVYEIKHDPLYLGFIGLVEALPALSLALVAGYVVDRGNPLKILKNVARLNIFSSLMLLTVSLPMLGVSQDLHLFALYLAAFLSGVGRGFRMPSNTALVPQLVPRNVLYISSAWTTSSTSMAFALGPALGGFLFAWKGPMAPYSLDFLAFSTGLLLLSLIKLDYQRPSKITQSPFQNLTAGLRYVFGHQLLLSALALDMFAVLFGGAVAMLPIFADSILHVGPKGLGILRAAPSLGALIGSFIWIRFPGRRHSGKILLVTVAGFGFCMIGFGFSTSFGLSLLLLAFGGAFDSVSMIIRGAIVQLSAPPEMRGRVGAVNSMFIGVSNQLGEFESGVAARLMGTAPSVIAGGVVTLIVVVLTALKAPRLRQMELNKL